MPTDYKQTFAPHTNVALGPEGLPPSGVWLSPYPPGVWSRTSQSWLPQTTGEGHQGDPREHNCKFGSATVRCGGRAEQSVEEHTPCFHCLDTGWFMLTAENDFGELEDYFVLSGASAKRRSVKFLGAAHVLVGEA
jgi:hypothetical protein